MKIFLFFQQTLLLLILLNSFIHAMIIEDTKQIIPLRFTYDPMAKIRYTSPLEWTHFNYLFGKHYNNLAMPLINILIKDPQKNMREINAGEFTIRSGIYSWDLVWNGLPLDLAKQKFFILKTKQIHYLFNNYSDDISKTLLHKLIQNFKENPVKPTEQQSFYERCAPQYNTLSLYTLINEGVLSLENGKYVHSRNSYFAQQEEKADQFSQEYHA